MTAEGAPTVLICDDDASQRHVLQEMMRRLGHACDTAAHGREALALLARRRYALLITDIFMDEMDGLELVREMRRRGWSLPVVAISGGFRGVLGPYGDFMTAMGAVAVIRKPFSADEIAAALGAVQDARRAPCPESCQALPG